MIPAPSGSRVWLATGHTDMRKGFDGLATLVQDPPSTRSVLRPGLRVPGPTGRLRVIMRPSVRCLATSTSLRSCMALKFLGSSINHVSDTYPDLLRGERGDWHLPRR